MDSDLRTRARRAYEQRRLWDALPWIIPATVLTLASIGLSGAWIPLPLGMALAALLVSFVWRGGVLGRAIVPGLLAGSLGWGIPTVWAWSVGCCGESCSMACTSVALVGGVVGGALLWRSAPSGALGSLAIASCCAAMGCVPLGVGGLVGLLALALVGLPAALPQLRPA